MSMPTAPDGLAHHSVTLGLAVDDAARAIDFYTRAFDAREIYRAPGRPGKIAHAQVRIGDTLLFLADEVLEDKESYRAPKTLGGTSCAVYLYLADADATFAQAVAAGATVLRPMTDEPWGDRVGLVRDPYGHLWALSTREVRP